MKNRLIASLRKSELNIVLLAISSNIFLLRSNIPYAIYIFAILQSVIIVKIVKEKNIPHLFSQLKQSAHYFYAYYLIIFFFIIAFFVGPRELYIYKEIINVVILISFILLYIITISSLSDFNIYKDYLLNSFLLLFLGYLVVSFIISLINNETNHFLFAINAHGTFDRNLYTLNLWVSIIAIINSIFKTSKKTRIIIGNIIIFLLLFLILLSSSRRGILFLSIFSALFIGSQIYWLLKSNNLYKKFKLLTILYITSLLLFISLFFLPANYKNQLFERYISDDDLKKEIGLTSWRYYRLIKPQINYKEYRKILWGTEINSNNKTDKSLSYKELLSLSEKAYSNKKYTNSINLAQKALKKTDSLEQYFKLLPKELAEKLPIQDKNIIPYLPELSKLTYAYTGFFSCININNLFLESYDTDTIDFPFVFSLKKEKAQINLTLAALAKSEYELNFKIKGENNPVDKLVIKNNTNSIINLVEKHFQQSDTITFNYKISVINNKNVSVKLSILLKNNVDSFALSDIKWKLLNTKNTDKPEIIYKKTKNELKKFKFEQNRSKPLWNYYFNAENLTSLKGQKKYSNLEITSLIDKCIANIKPAAYVSTKLEGKEKNQHKIIFQNSHVFSRARFDLPIIQNTIYQLEFDYINNNEIPLLSYFKRKPEIHNVQFEYEKLLDSTYNYSNNRFTKKIKFRVDSINSATALFAFGFKNLKQNDTITIKNFKFKLLEIKKDSVLLSEAQYNFLKNWAKRTDRKDELDLIKKETTSYENKEYWQIDSTIYESAAYDRIELLAFGWQYFKSLPIHKKVFGEGFEHLNIYSLKFRPKGSIENKGYSPHNPAMSALLYSGILGLIAYIFFLFQLFYFYIKYRKNLGIFLIIFLLIFSYIFFSSNGMFTDPVFIIFSLFPFLLNHIYKNNIKTKIFNKKTQEY